MGEKTIGVNDPDATPPIGSDLPRDIPDGSDPLIGRRLDDFVIIEKAAEGGYGSLYRAEQRQLGREAAIKVLQSRYRRDAAATQRFLREAFLASRLDHPYAAHIYGFGVENDGVMWIAMEFVHGTPLSKYIQSRGPMPLSRFVPLFDLIAEVVQTGHEQGIIHRDLKPSNVMVLFRAGRLLPKLVDWGIAKLTARQLDHPTPNRELTPPDSPVTDQPRDSPTMGDLLRKTGASPVTQSDIAVGTPTFMSPELWVNPNNASPQSDIYSLGVLAYYALTRRYPYDGDSALEIQAAQHAGSLAPLDPELPAALTPVFERVLSPDLGKRYQSATEFAADLRAAAGLHQEPSQIPQLNEELRSTLIADAPQPIADAVAALEASRSHRQCLTAAANTFRATLRFLGLLALSSRARVGPGASGDSPGVLALLTELRKSKLTDEQWLQLSDELLRPFAARKEIHPLPGLVWFFHSGEETDSRHGLHAGRQLLRELESLGSSVTDEATCRQTLPRVLEPLEQWLRGLQFLLEYRLAVGRDGAAELWSGSRRNVHPLVATQEPLPQAQPCLLDAEGRLVVSLWPLGQALAPSPEVPAELFMLEGNGRLGARLVAWPVAFERQDHELWPWFEQSLGLQAAEGAGNDSTSTPYLGLSSFTAKDAGNFFGREREAQACANRLRATSLLAVVGPSGSGKSSFVQAGIIPLLPPGWTSLVVRPGPFPLQTLASALASDRQGADQVRTLLQRDPRALASLLPLSSPGGRCVLVVDQFEELLTLCPSEDERRAYAEALVQSAGERLCVVLTLRDDYLIRAQQIPALKDRLTQGLQLLSTPGPEELFRIVTEPAKRAGVTFENAEIPNQMVAAVKDQAGALALISFTASKLWELRDRHLMLLTQRAYDSLGGVGGALGHHAEATLEQMTAEERPLVRQAFRHLVSAEGTRAVLSRKELLEVLGSVPAAERVLEQLIQARLLVASEGGNEPDRIEVIHEALLSSWPRLVRWQREDAESARLRDQLRAAARQWEEKGRGRGVLWRGEALAEYRIWRARNPGGLTSTEKAFADASLREEALGRRIRTALLVAAFLILCVGLAVLYRSNARALASGKESHERLAQMHAEQGRIELLSNRPLQGLAYLSRAMDEGFDDEGARFLVARAKEVVASQVASFDAGGVMLSIAYGPNGDLLAAGGQSGLLHLRDAHTGAVLHDLKGHTGQVTHVAFSSDGKRLVSASWDKTVRLWDVATGKLERTLELKTEVFWAEFSPDGRLVVTSGQDSQTRLWDVATGDLQFSWPSAEGTGQAVFSPDGALVATCLGSSYLGSRDFVAKVWNARTGKLVHELVHQGPVLYVAFSPRGDLIATAGFNGLGTLWNAQTGKKVATLEGHSGPIHHLAWSSTGAMLSTASADSTARVWDARDGHLVASLAGHDGIVRRVRFAGDGRRLFTAGDDALAIVWDMAKARELMRFAGHTGEITDLVASPDDRRLFTTSADGQIKVWSTEATLFRDLGPQLSLVGSWPDSTGESLFSFNPTSGWITWSLADGKPLEQAALPPATVPTDTQVYAWAPRGRWAAFTDETGNAHLISAMGDQDVPLGSPDVTALAFSVDGQRLAVGNKSGVITLRDLEGRIVTRIATPTDAQVMNLAFSPDGNRLVAATRDFALVAWQLDNGKRLFQVSDQVGELTFPVFSPDGRMVVTMAPDRSLRTWDASSGALLQRFEGHRGLVMSAYFSSDSQLLVSASGDGTARVWNVKTGRTLQVIRVGAFAYQALFDAGDRHVVTASMNGTLEWSGSRDRDSSAAIVGFARCHVPFEFSGGLLLPRREAASDCR